ncbi:MerR family transcriptional regulator [Caldalkalibacillus mannanilyticus]|uniref:MerR family transcriptional regulator n=1 Tax=Caldalkalibacillus mannanilyticus TaxID=1418 RepID=UPI00046AA581|nr:methyltransferase domain-containing protein [Caldalkalibacillus mannanilyticus]
MRIKEMAEKLNISARAIRFYEEKSLLTPLKDPQNQYRLFTEMDARRLQAILSLREVGMSIEEIRTLLEEIDRGEDDELLYSLELQRSMMFSQMVELKQHIDTTDRMIEHLKAQRSLDWEHIFELANGVKRLRDVRANWRDQWDFDRQAAIHDELVFNHSEGFNKHPSYEQALRMVVEWVKPHERERGLDIGTGTGNLAGSFLAAGIDMAGIDQSKEMLKHCQQKFPHLETKLGNFLAIPYLDHSFDFVVTSYALHHLTDEQKLFALVEMKRVLKPHGRICIVDLMFENEKKRIEHLDKLRGEGHEEVIAEIEDEYFADRSILLNWFEQNGYLTKMQQLSELLHILYAVPIRPGY